MSYGSEMIQQTRPSCSPWTGDQYILIDQGMVKINQIWRFSNYMFPIKWLWPLYSDCHIMNVWYCIIPLKEKKKCEKSWTIKNLTDLTINFCKNKTQLFKKRNIPAEIPHHQPSTKTTWCQYCLICWTPPDLENLLSITNHNNKNEVT